YSGTGAQLKGTYTVAPGADPARIRWRYAECGTPGPVGTPECGTEGLQVSVTANGDLQIMSSRANILTEAAPVAWQEVGGRRIPVAARYALDGDSVGFALSAYDAGQPLIIDPTLTYATYLGGTGDDAGNAIAVDTAGNIYIAGQTISTDFPLHNPLQ